MQKFLLPALLSALSTIIGPLAGMVDAAILGQGELLPLAGLTLANVWLDALGWVFGFLIHIPTREISYINSLSNEEKRKDLASLAINLALSLGVFASFILWNLAPIIWLKQGMAENLRDQAAQYLLVRAMGLPFQLAMMAQLGIFRGLKEYKTSLYLPLFSTLFNVLSGGVLFTLQKATLVNLGICSSLSFLLGFLGGLKALNKFINIRNLILPKNLFSLNGMKNFSHLGEDSLFLFGRSLLVVGTYFFIGARASELTIPEIAAYQVLLQLWMFSSYWSDGVAIVANTETAQALATAGVKQLRWVLKPILKLSLVVGLFFGLLYFSAFYFAWPTFFFNDPLAWSYVHPLIPLIALAQLPSSLAYVYDGIFFGLKAYKMLFKIIFISFVLGPLTILVYFQNEVSLLHLWGGLASFNFFRWAFCWAGVSYWLDDKSKN